MLLMPVGTLKNLLPYLLEEGKNHLAGFFVDNRNLRIFKDPLPGRVKPTAQRLRSNRFFKKKTLLERYQDYTQTRAAVLSEVSPENNYANCSNQNRASAPDAMENRSAPCQGQLLDQATNYHPKT